MAVYRTCPDCGAHLDADEVCDCTTYAIDEEESSDLRAPSEVI